MDGVSGRPGIGSSGTQPPSAGVPYAGPYLAGLVFEVTTSPRYLQGYWWWVPATNSQTAPQKFALWLLTGNLTGSLVANSVVTSGTLTLDSFNYVPLGTSILLTASVPYVAATGLTSTGGVPFTENQWDVGDPYAAGITNGPLYAPPMGGNAYNVPQSPYSLGGSDPSLLMPVTNDIADILWLDVQVSTS